MALAPVTPANEPVRIGELKLMTSLSFPKTPPGKAIAWDRRRIDDVLMQAADLKQAWGLASAGQFKPAGESRRSDERRPMEALKQAPHRGLPENFGPFDPDGSDPGAAELPAVVRALGEGLVGAVRRFFPSAEKRAPFEPFRARVVAAVASHPDVGVTAAQLNESEAAARESFAGLLPQISGTGDGGNRNTGPSSFTRSPEIKRDGLSFGVTARQLLWDFGATFRDVDASRSREEALQARLEARRSEFGLRAAGAHLELVRARRQLALAEQNVTAREEILTLVREREASGGGSLADVIRARARLTEAMAQFSSIETRLRSAEAAYQEAYGAAPPAELGAIPEMPAASRVTDAIDSLIKRFPSLKEAAALREAARADAQSRTKRMLPTLSFELSTLRRDLASSGIPATDTSALLVWRYNFYTGGAESARRDQAVARRAQVERQFESAVRQFERDLAAAAAEVRNGEALQSSREQASRAAVASLRAVREQFAFNRGTLLDLLRAQEELFFAGRDQLDASFDLLVAQLRLMHLTSELTEAFRLQAYATASVQGIVPGPGLN